MSENEPKLNRREFFIKGGVLGVGGLTLLGILYGSIVGPGGWNNSFPENLPDTSDITPQAVEPERAPGPEIPTGLGSSGTPVSEVIFSDNG